MLYSLCRERSRRLFAVASLLVAGSVHAAPVTYDFDFTGVAADVGPTLANVLSVSDTGTGSQTATVTSWFEVTPGGGFASANGQQATGAGWGVCNATEAPGAGCEGTWIDRSIDNTDGYDWILIRFTQAMDLSSFVVTPDLDPGRPNQKQGVDVSIFTGFINSDADADLAG